MTSAPDSEMPLPPDISRGYEYLAVQWSLVSVASVMVILRFCFRGLVRKQIGRDDFTILAALACALVQGALAVYHVRNGFGRNIQYLRPAEVKDTIRAGLVTIVFNIVGTSFVRVSVCLFVLQLLPFTQRVSRCSCYGLMVFFTLSALAVTLVVCFQCIPTQAIWNRSIHAKCLSPAVITKINQRWGAITVVMDFLCVLLPILVFGKLQISWREKLGVFTVLGLGLITAGAALARTLSYQFGSKNPTWDLVPEANWACAEQNVGIIVASMPVLRQLFNNFRTRRNIFRSQSSEKPLGRGDSLTRSPLSFGDFGSDNPASPRSPVSSLPRKGGTTRDVDSENKSSPTFSIASRLSRISLSAEKEQGSENHRHSKAKHCSRHSKEKHDFMVTLGNPAALGYACEIEGGPPKLRT